MCMSVSQVPSRLRESNLRERERTGTSFRNNLFRASSRNNEIRTELNLEILNEKCHISFDCYFLLSATGKTDVDDG